MTEAPMCSLNLLKIAIPESPSNHTPSINQSFFFVCFFKEKKKNKGNNTLVIVILDRLSIESHTLYQSIIFVFKEKKKANNTHIGYCNPK